jgi:long-chain acyl-CoA synthetase
LWKKFQLSILEKMGGEDALNSMLDNPGTAVTVREKIKMALGWQNVRLMVTGSAATSKSLHEWYEKLSLPLLDIYGQSEKTAETIIDGWVHTGDKGHIDDEGYLYVTGRVKDIFKTSKGKYVAPVPIEDQFTQAGFIEQLCLTGNGLPTTVLIAVLSEEGASLSKDDLETQFMSLVTKVNEGLGPMKKSAILSLNPNPGLSITGF